MAIIKIGAPLATAPNVFATPVINQLLALAVDCNHGYRIGGGVVKKGSLWNIGGAMYIADSDTAILGSKNQGLPNCAMAIKFSVSGNEATATYVSDLTGVSWNGEYQGNYDASGNMYYYKCKKASWVLLGGSSVFINAQPNAIEAKVLATESGVDIYRTVVEKTGSFNMVIFAISAIPKLVISINGISVVTVTTSGEVPLFIEEGDIIKITPSSSSSPVVQILGLCNDTFGSNVQLVL